MKRGGLVSDWKQAWKWFSVQGAAVLAICPVVYENTGFLQDFLPADIFHYGMGALGALTLISRLVRQGNGSDD